MYSSGSFVLALLSLMCDGVLWYKFTIVLEDHAAPTSGQTVANIYPQTPVNCYQTIQHWGTRWRSWLRHGATSRKVAGSIPDGVTGIFH